MSTKEPRAEPGKVAGSRRLPVALLCLVASIPGGLRAGEAPAEPPPAIGGEAASVRRLQGADGEGVRMAIERALGFLRRSQLSSGAVGRRYPVAVTSLAGLAVLGAGHRASGGPYAPFLANALRFLENSVDRPPGYISDAKSRMHGHCYAILFLTQIYGELGRDEQGEAGRMIRAGVKVILDSQTTIGGWYYEPSSSQGDEASLTICALQSLRAANGIGFVVPKRQIDLAIDYIRRCQVPEDGSFQYSLTLRDRHSSYALTVAAVSALHMAGAYDAPEARGGLAFALREVARSPLDPLKAAGKEFTFYGNFYAAQAFYQAGGEAWASWYPGARRWLLQHQASDGSWSDPYGEEIGTAFGALILEVPMDYLPIFQR